MTDEKNPEPTLPSEPLAPAAPSRLRVRACPACETASAAGTSGEPSRYIYTLGQVEPRFPSLAVEKEFAQVIGRAETAKLTNRGVMHAVLSERQNRYLARQLCWVLTVQGLETYVVLPRDPADLDLLIAAVRPEPSPHDLDTVIGVHAGTAPPELCNGLMVPIVLFDLLYSFDRATLLNSIPKPDAVSEEDFRPAAAEVFDRIIQMTGNTGTRDEHRALNYLAVRYPRIYSHTAEAFARDASLSAVEVRSSPLSGTRRIVEAIFAYTYRKTDMTEKFFVRVDVTEEFPFMVTKMSPYFDR